MWCAIATKLLPISIRQNARDIYGPFESWSKTVPHFREGPPPHDLVREGLFKHAFSYIAPVINMRRYLSWLTHQVSLLPGVSLGPATVDDIADVLPLLAA